MGLLRAQGKTELHLYSDRLIHKLFQVEFHTAALIRNYTFTAQLITQNSV
jgi:hypothetical protein